MGWGGAWHPCDPSPRSATVNGSSKRIFLSNEKVFGAWPGTLLRAVSRKYQLDEEIVKK